MDNEFKENLKKQADKLKNEIYEKSKESVRIKYALLALRKERNAITGLISGKSKKPKQVKKDIPSGVEGDIPE